MNSPAAPVRHPVMCAHGVAVTECPCRMSSKSAAGVCPTPRCARARQQREQQQFFTRRSAHQQQRPAGCAALTACEHSTQDDKSTLLDAVSPALLLPRTHGLAWRPELYSWPPPSTCIASGRRAAHAGATPCALPLAGLFQAVISTGEGDVGPPAPHPPRGMRCDRMTPEVAPHSLRALHNQGGGA